MQLFGADALARDHALMERVLTLAEQTVVPYHRSLVDGLENVPESPVLFVGNHNGATYSGDTFIFAARLWRKMGMDAVPYGLAHDLVMNLPWLGSTLRRLGVVPAHPEAADFFLKNGKNVLVYPGGDIEALRANSDRNRVLFGGRRGYIRTALRAGVPVVPIAAHGAHDTLYIFHNYSHLAERLKADRLLRVKSWPLSFMFPWGLWLGPTPPYFPFPSRIRIRCLPPLRFDRAGEEAAQDESYVADCARLVEGSIQKALLDMEEEARSSL